MTTLKYRVTYRSIHEVRTVEKLGNYIEKGRNFAIGEINAIPEYARATQQTPNLAFSPDYA